MGQITATRNLVATKVVRLAGQLDKGLDDYSKSPALHVSPLENTQPTNCRGIYMRWTSPLEISPQI